MDDIDRQKTIAQTEKWQQIDHFMSKIKGEVIV
jgi:hypothetical protein